MRHLLTQMCWPYHLFTNSPSIGWNIVGVRANLANINFLSGIRGNRCTKPRHFHAQTLAIPTCSAQSVGYSLETHIDKQKEKPTFWIKDHGVGSANFVYKLLQVFSQNRGVFGMSLQGQLTGAFDEKVGAATDGIPDTYVHRVGCLAFPRLQFAEGSTTTKPSTLLLAWCCRWRRAARAPPGKSPRTNSSFVELY